MIRCVRIGSSHWTRKSLSNFVQQNLRFVESQGPPGSPFSTHITRSNHLEVFNHSYYNAVGGCVKRTFCGLGRPSRLKQIPSRNAGHGTISIRLKSSGRKGDGKEVKLKAIKRTDLSRLLRLARKERWTLIGKPRSSANIMHVFWYIFYYINYMNGDLMAEDDICHCVITIY